MKLIKENKDVLIISFSSGLSGTFNSYNIAANELNEQYENKVYVIDSLCASLGQGLFLDYIVRYIEQGKTIKEVIDYAEDLKLKIRLEFTVDDLFHLKRGGRVGAASAMAASAIVEMMGGTREMCLQAATFALSNLLGLVCDPIAGLVESPCQSRNAIGVANALTSAELVLSGIHHHIPFDEMAEAMLHVGRSLPFELRETAMGGCAGTPTGCSLGCDICRK